MAADFYLPNRALSDQMFGYPELHGDIRKQVRAVAAICASSCSDNFSQRSVTSSLSIQTDSRALWMEASISTFEQCEKMASHLHLLGTTVADLSVH